MTIRENTHLGNAIQSLKDAVRDLHNKVDEVKMLVSRVESHYESRIDEFNSTGFVRNNLNDK